MALTSGEVVTGGIGLTEVSAEVLIAAGVLTVSAGGLVIVGAESGTTDDLTTINLLTGVFPAGYQLILYLTATIGDVITVKNGTGNIVTNTGADVSLTENKAVMLIRFIGTANSVVNAKWRAFG